MTTATKTETDLRSEIRTVEAEEFLTATNAGTFGAAECCKVVGTGESKYGEFRVYETVGGMTRTEGRDPNDAPGYRRNLNRDKLAARRRDLADLKAELRRLKK